MYLVYLWQLEICGGSDKRWPMERYFRTEIYCSRLFSGLDKKPKEIYKESVKSMESTSKIFPCDWRLSSLECRIWEKVRLGSDVVLGCRDRSYLTNESIDSLNQRRYYTLSQVADEVNTSIWNQGCHSAKSLGLEGNQIIDWNNYNSCLRKAHIRLKNEPDALAWAKNKIGGYYTAKLGYKVMFDSINNESCW
jgi:hypothetical protein